MGNHGSSAEKAEMKESLKELGSIKAFEKKYEVLGDLGDGAQGSVKKAKDKESEELFAVKCVDLTDERFGRIRKLDFDC